MISNKKSLPKFTVVCPHCNKSLENIKLGTNSYAEIKCPHCNGALWAKSTNNGIRTNGSIPPSD